MNGRQGGDPTKLARVLVQFVDQDEPPARWVAGADAVVAVEQKAHDLLVRLGRREEAAAEFARAAAAARTARERHFLLTRASSALSSGKSPQDQQHGSSALT